MQPFRDLGMLSWHNATPPPVLPVQNPPWPPAEADNSFCSHFQTLSPPTNYSTPVAAQTSGHRRLGRRFAARAPDWPKTTTSCAIAARREEIARVPGSKTFIRPAFYFYSNALFPEAVSLICVFRRVSARSTAPSTCRATWPTCTRAPFAFSVRIRTARTSTRARCILRCALDRK